MSKGPLDGCRILDLSVLMAAPLATMLLAEQGAEVIKVEPLTGDILRHMATSRGGSGSMFVNTNRSKRSIAIDLKEPRGIELVHRLAEDVDVFVESFRPGVADRLGVGYEAIKARSPNVVYARVNGFGTQGPFAGRRVYDPLVQAFSGINVVQGMGGANGPQFVRTLLADKVTPILLAQAITAALYERNQSGAGQELEVSMLHAMVWWLWPDMMAEHTFRSDDVVRGLNLTNSKTIFATRDGYLAVIAASDEEWRALAAAAERDDWVTDPRFETIASRFENNFMDEIETEMRTRTTEDWVQRLAACDAGFSPVNDPESILSDPQILANEMVTELDHQVFGPTVAPTFPVSFDRTPAATQSAPDVGEHTEEILRDRLGMDEAQIRALISDGVVRAGSVS